ncbi:MAG: hypothetical protein C3F13_12110 [Anaerolineales bacterium]|nr:hypothetical protein [Anaerolineae bacterium]PWB52266.1 MAG: hypothetical protein C3F13_12110 [Anaerolineales bacterium]
MTSLASLSIREDYWETFELKEEDREFIYNYLLEVETPLTSPEILTALVNERLRQEKLAIEKQRTSGGDIYKPANNFKVDQDLVFPALGWEHARVFAIRPGQNPDLGDFKVIKVKFDNLEVKEFAANIADHVLNQPQELSISEDTMDAETVLANSGDKLLQILDNELTKNQEFVRIAGKWFPRALLVDINVGHLNLAEAILDMAGGGPLHTKALLEQVGLASNTNSKLVEFSLDHALQEDPRFDEVGPSGEILWFLNRLEPESVLQVPVYLRYQAVDYDPSVLTQDMLDLEHRLDDELSPLDGKYPTQGEVQINLIFPHWRAGTLPLTPRLNHLIPTAYEAPRIRFQLVDGETGQKFPGWVVRKNHYVFGLKDWYKAHGLMPGSLIKVKRGKNPGEVIVQCDSQRGSREWVRTVLIGSDGGIVFAMLKQIVTAAYDERMAIAIPDPEGLDVAWKQIQKDRQPFEKIVVNIVRDLVKLNPQSHVHASELYAAVNIMRRCPPGPILALLASRPWFIHVGDLHYRFDDSEKS